MEIIKTEQIDSDLLLREEFDLLILCYGNGIRWRWLMDSSVIQAKKKILIVPDDGNGVFPSLPYIMPASFQHFETCHISIKDHQFIYQLMDRLCQEANQPFMKILIDYTSMTRPWYASFIHYFFLADHHICEANVYFAYMPAAYFLPSGGVKINETSPLIGSGWKTDNHKPVALILGLGFEAKPAEDIVRQIKPDQLFLFYDVNDKDERFNQEVIRLNNTLLKSVSDENIKSYSARNMDETDRLITDVVLNLRFTHKVIIAPMGPKAFALVSFLLHLRYPDIEVWDSGHEAWMHVTETTPSGTPIIYRVDFSND